MSESPAIDKTLRRLKDFVLLGGIAWAILSGSINFYGLPEKVKNAESNVAVIDKRLATAELRIQAVEQSAAFIQKSLDELKAYQMEILKRVSKLN